MKLQHLAGVFLIFSLVFWGCRPEETMERIGRLETRVNELNNSHTYWGDMAVDDLVETREEVVLLLLEEGERQLNLAQRDPLARRRAAICFQSVVRLSGGSYGIQDVELQQQWPILDALWDLGQDHGSGDKKIWNICELAIPPLWPWTISSRAIGFIADLIFGWEDVERAVNVPPLAQVYVQRAQMGLEVLNSQDHADPGTETGEEPNNEELELNNEDQTAPRARQNSRRHILPEVGEELRRLILDNDDYGYDLEMGVRRSQYSAEVHFLQRSIRFNRVEEGSTTVLDRETGYSDTSFPSSFPWTVVQDNDGNYFLATVEINGENYFLIGTVDGAYDIDIEGVVVETHLSIQEVLRRNSLAETYHEFEAIAVGQFHFDDVW